MEDDELVLPESVLVFSGRLGLPRETLDCFRRNVLRGCWDSALRSSEDADPLVTYAAVGILLLLELLLHDWDSCVSGGLLVDVEGLRLEEV